MADNRFSIDYAKREVKKGEGILKSLMIQSVFVVHFMKLAVGTSNFDWGIFLDLFNVLYTTLFYLPPLKFHCVGVGGCWDGIKPKDCCDLGIGSPTL
jgi:hypothetical protein